MDSLTQALTNPFPVNNETMDSAFLQHLQQALTAVQIVQCLQSAREELENKHLPAQMAQLASYLTTDPTSANKSLSNQEGNQNASFFQSSIPSLRSQFSNHPLDVISESSETLSESTGCPVSPISHLPSLSNPLNRNNYSAMGKNLMNYQTQSVNQNLNSMFNNQSQNMKTLNCELNESEKKFFIDADFEIHEDENEWLDNVLITDEQDFSFNQDNHPSTSLIEDRGYETNHYDNITDLQDGMFSNYRGNRGFSDLNIQNGDTTSTPSELGMKRKRNDENESFNISMMMKMENDINKTCKGARPRQARGTATDPQSVSARKRRERISKKIRTLQELVPNARSMDTASMLEQAIFYVRNLEDKVQRLRCKK